MRFKYLQLNGGLATQAALTLSVLVFGLANAQEKGPVDSLADIKSGYPSPQARALTARPSDDCYVDNGVSYKGTDSTTTNGADCQNWENPIYHSIWPHVQTVIKADTLGRFGNHNYCRNPDQDPSGLWCFTTDPNYTWGYCKVDKCDAAVENCLKGDQKGTTYVGTVSETENKVACVKWEDVRNNINNDFQWGIETYKNFIPKGTNHNNCRNYFDSKDGPMCFTATDGSWGLCEIPDCKEADGEAGPEGDGGNNNGNNNVNNNENTSGDNPNEIDCGYRCTKGGSCRPDIGDTNFIIGGESAEPGEFPWQVQLRTSWGGGYCGGSILNRRWILTAGHCVTAGEEIHIAVGWQHVRGYKASSGGSTVRVTGTIQDLINDPGRNHGKDVIRVQKAINHEYYANGQNIQWDISLLMLERDIKYGSNEKSWSRPACLPKGGINGDFHTTVDKVTPNLARDLDNNGGLKEGANCIISGWGLTNQDVLGQYGYRPTNDGTTLQYVRMDILAEDKCYWQQIMKPESQVCIVKAQDDNEKMFTGSCSGDSGGPMTCSPTGTEVDGEGKQRMVLLGLTSYGAANGCPFQPSVYTRTSFYLEWIKKTIRETEATLTDGRTPSKLMFIDKDGIETFESP